MGHKIIQVTNSGCTAEFKAQSPITSSSRMSSVLFPPFLAALWCLPVCFVHWRSTTPERVGGLPLVD